MQEKKNDSFYLLLAAIGMLILVISAIYFLKIRKSSDQEMRDTGSAETQNSGQKNNEKIKSEEVQIENEPLAEEKKLEEAPNEELRQKIIAYLVKNLDQLIFPPQNDKWDLSGASISFIGNTYLYLEIFPAEAEVGGMKVLYKAESLSSGEIKLQELAKYKEGEEDWQLLSGEDKFFDYYYEEYGYDDEDNKWSQIEYMIGTEDEGEDKELSEEEIESLEAEEALLDEEGSTGSDEQDEAEKTIVP